MTHKPQYTKAFTALLTFALLASGCTKKRDAALPDAEALQTFAISDFGTIQDDGGFKVTARQSVRAQSSGTSSKATEEKGLVAVDADNSSIPSRMRFMFNNLEVSGQETGDFKVVFGVDAKYVTAYKITGNINALSSLEKQIAVTPGEVQMSIEMQKTKTATAKKSIADKMMAARKARVMSLTNRANINVLIPLFKYEIQSKGILERTKNELRESTSTLTLRETEFSQATHVKLATTSDARKDVGSVDQKKELDQIFTMDSIDNKVSTAAELQQRLNFNMKFIADDSQVLTKLDSDDMKVYEVVTMAQLTDDEQRLIKTGRANGEILRCSDQSAIQSKDANCVLRLVATVPLTYKKITLNLADKNDNTSNAFQMDKVTKAQSTGLVEIAREVRATRARPSGLIDPLNTIKIADLKGNFYFRRTFEQGSNMMVIGKAGTSGDMSVVQFELEKSRLVVRNQKALIEYVGQGAQDKEELMSVPVKYFKLESVDADGVALQVPKLIEAKKEDAEYLEIDWTANTIPVSNSPLAYYAEGQCLMAKASQTVTDMDMRLATDGMLNFSLAGSYTVLPACANQIQTNSAYFSVNAQFNYNLSERVSFRRVSDQSQFTQFAPNISPDAQNAMNFAIFTLADVNTSKTVRAGRQGSEIYRPVIHDFRNGKTLTYWVGGLSEAPAERRELITQAAKEVVAEWNEAFHKVFKGTENDRSGDYVLLNIEDDSNRGHLGDLDRNYLWFMDKETENGLLGVAQPAPNPYSGTIVANNVIVYSGNSEKEVRGFIDSYKEIRAYEKLLEEAKTAAVADMQKQLAEQKAGDAGTPASTGNATADQVEGTLKSMSSYLNKLVLSARPKIVERMSSKWASLTASSRKTTPAKKSIKGRTQVADTELTSTKAFTRSILQKALQGEFKNDPLMMEAIITKELARTEPGLSPEMKALLLQQADAKAMSAKFDAQAKKRGGCFMYSRNEYNDKFLSADFDTLFKKEIKATLSHEIGHALGLVHNFKASYDRANFQFEGENNDRDYSSIMDYLASTEMGYHGPGPYDVHALRAIYTSRIEVSPEAKAMAAKNNGVLALKAGSTTVKDGLMNIADVQKILGLATEADMRKQVVNRSGLLKYYGQCHDGQVGEEPACTPYDSGSTATDIVKNTIQDYNRMYITSYHAADRLNFGYSQKIGVVRRAIQKFQTVRGFLDDYFKMLIYETANSDAELADFRQASFLGYDFFHDLLRTPDTNLSYGKDVASIKKRLIAVPYTYKKAKLVKAADGSVSQAVDAKGQPQFDDVPDVKVLEARRIYDAAPSTDRIETVGIGYDKAFALEFLLTANPSALTDDSQVGWISYNEFEQYFSGVTNANQSLNMMTLLQIMTGTLPSGFMDPNHQLVESSSQVKINRTMLDNATLGSLASTNSYRMPGLDTYAEFFKIGTLKGGKALKDRLTVARFGQSSKSAAGIKFFATDNGQGANVLVSMAARKAVYIENKQDLGNLMLAMVKADLTLNSKIAALKQADPKLKDATTAQMIAGSDELKALQAAADKAVADLTKALTALNVKDVLVSAQEVASNPNLALDKQVLMLRGMMMKSMSSFNAIATLLGKVPVAQLAKVFEDLAAQKQTNDQLATLDLLAMGQELLSEAVANVEIPLQSGEKASGSELMGIMMTPKALTSGQENLMYVIEDLARFTSILNPEYTY